MIPCLICTVSTRHHNRKLPRKYARANLLSSQLNNKRSRAALSPPALTPWTQTIALSTNKTNTNLQSACTDCHTDSPSTGFNRKTLTYYMIIITDNPGIMSCPRILSSLESGRGPCHCRPFYAPSHRDSRCYGGNGTHRHARRDLVHHSSFLVQQRKFLMNTSIMTENSTVVRYLLRPPNNGPFHSTRLSWWWNVLHLDPAQL